MCIKYLFAFIIALLTSLSGTAQSSKIETKEILQKIDKELNNIKTVVYKINYTNKYFARRDTIYTTAICSLYIALKDKMKAYSIVDLQFSEKKDSTYGHRRYDGKRAFWTNYPLDSLDIDIKPDIESKKRIRQAIVQNYSYMLLREYLMQKNSFGKYESSAGLIGITEEVHKGIPVYIITIAFKEHEGVSDNVEKHYIRKSDFMPVAFSSFMRWESMEQYNYYEVDYLDINPDISLEEFKINKNETINAGERYKAFEEKAKI